MLQLETIFLRVILRTRVPRFVEIRIVEDSLNGAHVFSPAEPLFAFPLDTLQSLSGGLSVPLGERDFSSRSWNVARITDDRRSFWGDMIICNDNNNASESVTPLRASKELEIFNQDNVVASLD